MAADWDTLNTLCRAALNASAANELAAQEAKEVDENTEKAMAYLAASKANLSLAAALNDEMAMMLGKVQPKT